MTDSTPQPEPVDPNQEPDQDLDQDLDERGPVDGSEREDRPGVTKDPDDPEDTDFEASPGLVD